MNKIILRFYILKNDDFFEVLFDKRLSFNENFNLLKEIYDFPFFTYIFDKTNNIALKKDIPIKDFDFNNFMTLYLV